MSSFAISHSQPGTIQYRIAGKAEDEAFAIKCEYYRELFSLPKNPVPKDHRCEDEEE